MDKQDKVSIKPNMDSSEQDPHGSDDEHSNPANETADASQELNNQDLVDRTVCSKSHLGDSLTESSLDKCVSPSSSHGAMEIENKVMSTSPVKEILHPSPKCQEISLNDTSTATTHPLDAPDSLENPALDQETSAENPVEPVSDWKCRSPTTENFDSSELESVPVIGSELVHNAMSSKEVDMIDAHEVLEAVPSEGLSEENITKVINEKLDVSGSPLHHADASSLLVGSNLNGETAYEGERSLYVGTEVGSNVMQSDSDSDSDESGLNASTDSSETDSE